jgi:hypothetical protein
MSAPLCPRCGGTGRLATNVVFDLWRCTQCRREYFAQHDLCQHPSCASWTDNDTDYCYYHLAQQGIHPPERDKDPSICRIAECTREITDHGAGLCDYHAWDAAHRPEYDDQ